MESSLGYMGPYLTKHHQQHKRILFFWKVPQEPRQVMLQPERTQGQGVGKRNIEQKSEHGEWMKNRERMCPAVGRVQAANRSRISE